MFGHQFHGPRTTPIKTTYRNAGAETTQAKFSDFYVDHTVSSHENTKHFFSAKVTRLALTVMSVLAQFFQFTVWGSTPWGGKYAMQGWESRPKL